MWCGVQLTLFHSDEVLNDDYTVMDVAYITAWSAVSMNQPKPTMSVELFVGQAENAIVYCGCNSTVQDGAKSWKKPVSFDSEASVIITSDSDDSPLASLKTRLQPPRTTWSHLEV